MMHITTTYSVVLAAFILCNICASAKITVPIICIGDNEITLAGPGVAPTCDYHKPPDILGHVDVTRCHCKTGYVFIGQHNKTCIPLRDCPKSCIDPNAQYETCGSTCLQTCTFPAQRPCNPRCYVGCSCRPPYVLSEATLKCILPSECR